MTMDDTPLGTKELSRKQRKLLNRQVIGEDGPGTILRDFDTLLDFVGLEGMQVTDAQHFLPVKVLPQLNARLTHPVGLGLQRAQQKSYPHIHGLYWLLRATGLTYVDESAAKPRLVVDEEALQSWRSLNPTERYFTLLEAWLLYGRPEIIGEPGGWHSYPVLSWAGFFRWISDGGLAIAGDSRAEDSLKYFPGLQGVALLELFGLLRVEHGAPEAKKGWRIVRLFRTELGDALLALLARTLGEAEYMYRFAGETDVVYGALQPIVEPFFPEFRNNLVLPGLEFRDGVYVFKVSLWDIWRRIAIPAKLTLDDLAAAILNAYKFDFDHLWKFSYQTRFGWSMHIQHSFMDEGPWTDEELVGNVPLRAGERMVFLYDFGDNWEFDVALERIDPVDPKITKPIMLEAHGEAPEQYPSWEEW